MKPKINLGMIENCLAYVTTIWFAEHDEPPESVEGYKDYVEDMRLFAKSQGDLDYLKLGLEYLLNGGAIDVDTLYQLSGSNWDFDDEEVLKIMRYVYSEIWPTSLNINSGRVPDVELLKMGAESSSLNKWKATKNALNPNFDISKVKYCN